MDTLTNNDGLVDFLYSLESNKNKTEERVFFVLAAGIFIGKYTSYNLEKGYVEIYLTEHVGTQHLRSDHFYISLSSILAWGVQSKSMRERLREP